MPVLPGACTRALEEFGTYWRDYDFNDFEDLRGLRDTLHEFVLEAHAAFIELEAARPTSVTANVAMTPAEWHARMHGKERTRGDRAT